MSLPESFHREEENPPRGLNKIQCRKGQEKYIFLFDGSEESEIALMDTLAQDVKEGRLSWSDVAKLANEIRVLKEGRMAVLRGIGALLQSRGRSVRE